MQGSQGALCCVCVFVCVCVCVYNYCTTDGLLHAHISGSPLSSALLKKRQTLLREFDKTVRQRARELLEISRKIFV